MRNSARRTSAPKVMIKISGSNRESKLGPSFYPAQGRVSRSHHNIRKCGPKIPRNVCYGPFWAPAFDNIGTTTDGKNSRRLLERR